MRHEEVVITVAAFAAVAAFVLGCYVGIRGEREAWTVHARPGASHHCDGVFYVIMREDEFVRDYQLKPKEPLRWEIEEEDS